MLVCNFFCSVQAREIGFKMLFVKSLQMGFECDDLMKNDDSFWNSYIRKKAI